MLPTAMLSEHRLSRLPSLFSNKSLTHLRCAVDMQSVEADTAMGHQVAKEVEKGLGIVPPDETTAYVKAVGQQLAKARTPGNLRLPGNIVGSVLSEDLGNLINAL